MTLKIGMIGQVGLAASMRTFYLRWMGFRSRLFAEQAKRKQQIWRPIMRVQMGMMSMWKCWTQRSLMRSISLRRQWFGRDRIRAY